MTNTIQCNCARREHPGYGHSYKCAISDWQRKLYDDWDDDDVIEGIYTELEDEMEQAKEEEKYGVSPIPTSSKNPEEWTDTEWDVLMNALDEMSFQESDYWEAIVESMIEAQDPVPSSVLTDECNCDSEKFNNLHLMSCPLSSDYDAKTTKPYVKSSYVVEKCSHDRNKTFELAPDMEIYLSSWRDVKYADAENIDIGIYLYDGWANGDTLVSPGLEVPWVEERQTKAVMLDWTDYAAYKNLPHLRDIVEWALNSIAAGKRFEIGCMGGHGRTGTLAACMTMAAHGKLSPPEAITQVRTEHCKKAVESLTQVEMVADFYKEWHGHENWRGSKSLRKEFDKLKPSKAATTTYNYQSTGYVSTWKPGRVWDVSTNTYIDPPEGNKRPVGFMGGYLV